MYDENVPVKTQTVAEIPNVMDEKFDAKSTKLDNGPQACAPNVAIANDTRTMAIIWSQPAYAKQIVSMPQTMQLQKTASFRTFVLVIFFVLNK